MPSLFALLAPVTHDRAVAENAAPAGLSADAPVLLDDDELGQVSGGTGPTELPATTW